MFIESAGKYGVAHTENRFGKGGYIRLEGYQFRFSRQMILVCTLILISQLQNASLVSVCNDTVEYQCSNGRCIDLEKFNNSINDCFDNSDEVPNPCRKPMFSCMNDRCILPLWVLDGVNDCLDYTDEVKLVGTSCLSAVNCCFCEQFIPNSICLHGNCQCRHGYYSNRLGNYCIIRVIGDSCQYDLDCSRVISHSICTNVDQHQQPHQCQCISGYYPSETKDICIKRRQIGDQCFENDSECSPISNSVCFNSLCRCIQGYRQTQDGYFCHFIAINDPCITDMDCTVPLTYCIRHTCLCPSGWQAVNNRTNCKLRKISSICVTDDDCSMAVNNSICSEGRCKCSIEHDLSPVTRNNCIYASTLQRDKIISTCLLTAVIFLVIFMVFLSWYFTMKLYELQTGKRSHNALLLNEKRSHNALLLNEKRSHKPLQNGRRSHTSINL